MVSLVVVLIQVVQVIQPRSLESLAPRLVGRDGKPLVKNGVIDQQAVDNYLSEEELLDGDDDADMSILPQEVTPAVSALGSDAVEKLFLEKSHAVYLPSYPLHSWLVCLLCSSFD